LKPGGSTGIPKSRINIEDFRLDYSAFSETLPEKFFPKGSDWLEVGPSGPRRLRLAIEHLAQVRGGICYMVDLDPRFVIKLIKWGEMAMMERYKQHVIDQALTLIKAHSSIKCLFTTPKLLEALCEKISLEKAGITGVFCGGTEMTPQFHRFAVEELCGPNVHFAPTYGNTLMGLAVGKPRVPEDNYAVIYYPPAPRGDCRGPRSQGHFAHRGLRRDRPRLPHHHDEGVLHAALPRARPGRTRGPERRVPVRRRPQRAPVLRDEPDRRGRGLLMIHLPLLRKGEPYVSLDTAKVPHYRTGERGGRTEPRQSRSHPPRPFRRIAEGDERLARLDPGEGSRGHVERRPRISS
jgi:hypothetical protein